MLDRAGVGDDTIDIETLLEEIRHEAETLRQRAGASRVGSNLDPAELLRKLADAGPARPAHSGSLDHDQAIARMRDNADPQSTALGSHRKVFASPILLAKRILRRLLSPFLEQQARFNGANLDALVDLGRRLDVLEQSLAHQRTRPADGPEPRD